MAHRVAPLLNTGIVWVNTWNLRDLRTPFSGPKQSDRGREGGLYSLEFYTELTNICIEIKRHGIPVGPAMTDRSSKPPRYISHQKWVPTMCLLLLVELSVEYY